MRFIKKISRDFPVGNAAGWCKSLEAVEQLSQSACQCIVVGSITVFPREGNPGNVFDGASLNSLGLPNPGIHRILAQAKEMIETAHAAGKPIILSIAGFAPAEYYMLARVAYDAGFDGVEINLGCPNVVDGGTRKPIASFDLELTRMIVLSTVLLVKGMNPRFFVSVKVSPFSNPLGILDTAEFFNGLKIDAVVTQNTFPNALLFDAASRLVIDTGDGTGWAGWSGKAIKPMALGQVSQWRRSLIPRIAVWGVGGVETGLDVRDMKVAGAEIVQVGTAYFVQGPKIFSDIASEYLDL